METALAGFPNANPRELLGRPHRLLRSTLRGGCQDELHDWAAFPGVFSQSANLSLSVLVAILPASGAKTLYRRQDRDRGLWVALLDPLFHRPPQRHSAQRIAEGRGLRALPTLVSSALLPRRGAVVAGAGDIFVHRPVQEPARSPALPVAQRLEPAPRLGAVGLGDFRHPGSGPIGGGDPLFRRPRVH